MLLMLLNSFAIDDYVVNKAHATLTEVRCKYFIDMTNESWDSIGQAKTHHQPLKTSELTTKGSFRNIVLMHRKLMIALSKVKRREVLSSLHLFQYRFDVGQGILILFGNVVDWSVVDDHP